MVQRNIAVFFDFDKTLLAGDSAEIGIDFLWKQHQISPWLMVQMMLAFPLYKLNLLSSAFMAGLAIKLYAGKQLQVFEDGVPDFYFQELKPRLAANMLEIVEDHRRKGHRLVLLSASVMYMLEVVVRDLRFDHLLCTELETGPDGILTGRTVGEICIGPAKAVAARKLAETLDLDLSQSFAYGDHQSDLAILELVGHPVAVSPDKALRQIARKRGWPIIEHT